MNRQTLLTQGLLNKYEIIDQNYVEDQLKTINKKYQFPASYKKANLHKHSVGFGFNQPKVRKMKRSRGQQDTGDQQQQYYGRPKLCPCCNQPINTEAVPLTYNTTDVQKQEYPFKLDSGVSMFFSFIKMTILYLFLVFLICDCFNLITSLYGNYCDKHKEECQSNFFGYISTYNKYKDQSMFHQGYTLDFLCMIVTIGSIIFFITYRKIQYNIYEIIDQEHQTQDDYTILVENIPILDFKKGISKQDKDWVQFDYQYDLKDIFEKKINDWIDWMEENHEDFEPTSPQSDICSLVTIDDLRNKNKVKSVTLCFNLTELQKVQQSRDKLMQEQIKKYAAEMKNGTFNIHNTQRSNDMGQFSNQIQYMNGIEVALCQKYAIDNTPTFNITHFVGKAFVSFQYQHYRQHIMQKYEQDPLVIKYEGKSLIISRATHPTDIFWKNMKIQDSDRFKKVITSYMIILMIIVFAAFALVGIDAIKVANISKGLHLQAQSIALNFGLTITASVITLAINYGISMANTALTEYQKHMTRTNEQTSLIVKMLITQFINNAFIYYLISIINWRPFMSSAGLIVQVSFLLVVSGLIQIFMNAINVPNVMRIVWLYVKYGYTRYENVKDKQIPTFQIKLNKDFQLPTFNIAGRYSYYLLQTYTCLFYSYLVPVGVPVIAVIFVIQFWIDKFNLFKTSSQSKKFNYFLSRSALKLFEGSLLAFTLGNLLFSMIIHDRYLNLINLASLCIAVLYVGFITFAPSNLERKLFAKYQTLEQLSYQQCVKQHKFHHTYWTQNPGTVFVKEVNINDNNQYVDQGSDDQYYDVDQFVDEWAEDQLIKKQKSQQHNNDKNDDGW